MTIESSHASQAVDEPEVVYNLLNWPSLEDPSSEQIRMMTLLASNRLTLDQLTHLAGVEQDDVVSFLNLMNDLECLNAEYADPAPLPSNVIDDGEQAKPGLPIRRPAGASSSTTTLRTVAGTDHELARPVSPFGAPRRRRVEHDDDFPELVFERSFEEPKITAESTQFDEIRSHENFVVDPSFTSTVEPVETGDPDTPALIEPAPKEDEPAPVVEPVEDFDRPASQLYPAFNPSAPPIQPARRRPRMTNPNIKLEPSFLDILNSSNAEESEPAQKEPKESKAAKFLKFRLK